MRKLVTLAAVALFSATAVLGGTDAWARPGADEPIEQPRPSWYPKQAPVKPTLPPPPPAVRVTHVEVTGLDSSWDFGNAINWVDGFTKSDMQISKCVVMENCIRIRSGSVGNPNFGWTDFAESTQIYPDTGYKWFDATITIDTAKAKTRTDIYGYYTKRYLLDHELGHAHGLGHNPYCTSTMNPNARCNGKVPPRVFLTGEKNILGSR